jgi:hypothetical protein
MNNSSDSDNNNNEIKVKIDAPKKRGRPRKNLFLDKPAKNYEKKEITNDEKDIILHLPVSMKKNNSYESDKKNTKSYDKNISLEDSEEELEDSYNSDDSNFSENSDSQFKSLYKKERDENKKKDIVIKKLKDELNRNKSNLNIFDSDIQKDLTSHIVNMNIIDNNTNILIEIKRTDLNCWWDTCPINNYPYVLPEKFYNGKFYVFGCFCSINCAASYNLNMTDYKVMERYALLKKLYEKNITDTKMKLAAPKEILKKYGGIVDIEDYRKNFITCDKEFRMNIPPLVSLHHIIEEITIEKNENLENLKSNIHNIKKKLPMVKNNLFNTMGIKNK